MLLMLIVVVVVVAVVAVVVDAASSPLLTVLQHISHRLDNRSITVKKETEKGKCKNSEIQKMQKSKNQRRNQK